jgi:hypothetical protein
VCAGEQKGVEEKGSKKGKPTEMEERPMLEMEVSSPQIPSKTPQEVHFTIPEGQPQDTTYLLPLPPSLPIQGITDDMSLLPEVTFFGITYPLWDDTLQGSSGQANECGEKGERVGGGRKRWKRSDYWVTETYMVRPEIVAEVVETFGVEPQIDVFADGVNHVLPRWWGPGGEKEDAWEESWNFLQQGYLWLNPPYGELWGVVDKVVHDGARAILVCPNWPRDKWWKKLMALVVDEVWYPKGTKFFLRQGKLMSGTK